MYLGLVLSEISDIHRRAWDLCPTDKGNNCTFSWLLLRLFSLGFQQFEYVFCCFLFIIPLWVIEICKH